MTKIQMSLKNIYIELEKIFRQQILDSYPSDWDEDYITRKILFEYRKLFRDIEIYGFASPINIESAAYKLRGKAEYNFGDIGLIIKISHPKHPPFEGVTSLEAKKIHKKKRTFDEIKGEQLNRISSRLKYPMLLMYDNQPIEQYHDFSCLPLITKNNHAATASIDIVNSILKYDKNRYLTKEKTYDVKSPLKNDLIYKFSIPLAYQILFRYFRGLDLDINQNLINTIRGFEDDENLYNGYRLPQYCLIIVARYGDSDIDTEFLSINDNIWSPLTSS